MFGSWSDDGRGEQRLIFTSVDIVVGSAQGEPEYYRRRLLGCSVFDSRNLLVHEPFPFAVHRSSGHQHLELHLIQKGSFHIHAPDTLLDVLDPVDDNVRILGISFCALSMTRNLENFRQTF